MENKHEGNENKIILGDFNCTTDISLFIKSSFKEDARTFSENSRKY